MALNFQAFSTLILLLFLDVKCGYVKGQSTEYVFAFLTGMGHPSEQILFTSAQFSNQQLQTEIRISAKVSDGSYTANGSLETNTQMSSLIGHASQMMVSEMNNVSRKAIVVTASSDIVVYGLSVSVQDSSSDGFLALPTSILTGNYTIITPPAATTNQSISKNEIAVVALQKNTCVHLLSRNKTIVLSLVLNQEETYEYAVNKELTGYSVQSDKKVAVMAGNRCASIPYNEPDCDHMIEMLPPTESLGKEFILSPLQRNCNFASGHNCTSFFKIAAAYDGTVVTRYGTDSTETFNLSSGDWIDMNPPSTAVSYLSATKPIIAAQFAASHTYTGFHDGDPFFTLVQPIKDYGNEYTILTCLSQFKLSYQYLNIDIKTEAVMGLKIGGFLGQNLSIINLLTCKVVPNSAYSACSYHVPCHDVNFTSPMTITIKRDDPTVKFSMLVYGYASKGSYAYIGGSKTGHKSFGPTSSPPTHTSSSKTSFQSYDSDSSSARISSTRTIPTQSSSITQTFETLTSLNQTSPYFTIANFTPTQTQTTQIYTSLANPSATRTTATKQTSLSSTLTTQTLAVTGSPSPSFLSQTSSNPISVTASQRSMTSSSTPVYKITTVGTGTASHAKQMPLTWMVFIICVIHFSY